MIQRQRTALKRRRAQAKLPPDFDEFREWLDSLPISRGAKQTAIAGVRKAFSMGLTSADEVRDLPSGTKGLKSMRYGMNKYEEFRTRKMEENSV